MGFQSLGQEDPLEKGMATHSFSCLENPMDRGVWRATVHGVTKSQTRLSTHAGTCTVTLGVPSFPSVGAEGNSALPACPPSWLWEQTTASS